MFCLLGSHHMQPAQSQRVQCCSHGAATSSQHLTLRWVDISPVCVHWPVLRLHSPHVAAPGCPADRRLLTLIRLAQRRLFLQDISHDNLGEHTGGC